MPNLRTTGRAPRGRGQGKGTRTTLHKKAATHPSTEKASQSPASRTKSDVKIITLHYTLYTYHWKLVDTTKEYEGGYTKCI